MSTQIKWHTEMNEALELGRETDKPVLLDFFNPQ